MQKRAYTFYHFKTHILSGDFDSILFGKKIIAQYYIIVNKKGCAEAHPKSISA